MKVALLALTPALSQGEREQEASAHVPLSVFSPSPSGRGPG